MKKNWLLPLSLSLLFSCSQNNCYQCLMGNMILSEGRMEYEQIKEIPDQCDFLTQTYYTDCSPLSEANDIAYFEKTVTISSQEIGSLTKAIDEEDYVLYFFCQIPSGYQVIRRNNIQKQTDSGIIMVTDNFYYFGNRPDLFYLELDLKKDDSQSEPSQYSFYYQISRTYEESVKEENIRVILQHYSE